MNPITQSQMASRVNAISPTPHGTWSEKRIAFLVLALALAAQIAWMLFHQFGRQAPWLSMSWSLEFALPFLLLLLTGGRIRWIASLLRLPISMAFLLSVGDRLGLLGPPGSPGVAWGDLCSDASGCSSW
jgi:hypothetical protein